MINILFLLSHRSQFNPFLGYVDFRRGNFIYEFKKLGVSLVDFYASHLRNLPAALAVAWRLI